MFWEGKWPIRFRVSSSAWLALMRSASVNNLKKFRRKLRVRISFQLHLIQNIWIRWFRWNFKLPPEDNEPSVPLSRPLLGTGCYPAGWTLPSAIECCELQLFIQDPAEERNQWGQELFSICQRHLLDNLMCSSAASLFIFSYNKNH